MPTLNAARRPAARRPQLERDTPIVAIAVARQVVEEVSLFLRVPMHPRYAAGLAFRAQRCYAHSLSFREKVKRGGDRGLDLLYVFMRHWLAARLRTERPALYQRLPREFAVGVGLRGGVVR